MEAQLTLNDIAAVVQLIDVVSARGAIRGEEMTQIGALRDRYVAFLQSVTPPQGEATTGTAGEQSSDDSDQTTTEVVDT